MEQIYNIILIQHYPLLSAPVFRSCFLGKSDILVLYPFLLVSTFKYLFDNRFKIENNNKNAYWEEYNA